MSAPGNAITRSDLALGRDEAEAALQRFVVGHFATVDAAGDPYLVPNLYVYEAGLIRLHTAASGHFRHNMEARPRACFEAAEMGEVYPYGEFACDSSASYISVVARGSVRIETDRAAKSRFFDCFLAKSADPAWEQPGSFYPRIDRVTVYCLTLEQISGKRILLPLLAAQWPAVNRTKSPGAVPPSR